MNVQVVVNVKVVVAPGSIRKHREVTCGVNLAAPQGVRDGLGSEGLAPVRRTDPG